MESAASDEGQDIISNLPEDLKSKILSYLPTRNAVKTCMLSSKWRNTWAAAPEILIRENDFVSSTANERKAIIARSRLVDFINILLYLHDGPIFKFKLEIRNCGGEYFRSAFNLWLLHLSRRKEFREFYFTSRILYNLSTNLFLCHRLCILELHDCRINLPNSFEGFKLMRVLKLQECIISGDDMEKFVSSCPLLDEFVLRTTISVSLSLKICAAKLKKLIIRGKFASLLLRTPSLVKACFHLLIKPSGVNTRANLVEALGALPEVEVLGLHERFFEVT